MDDDQFAILQEHIEIIKRDATESKNKTLVCYKVPPPNRLTILGLTVEIIARCVKLSNG